MSVPMGNRIGWVTTALTSSIVGMMKMGIRMVSLGRVVVDRMVSKMDIRLCMRRQRLERREVERPM